MSLPALSYYYLILQVSEKALEAATGDNPWTGATCPLGANLAPLWASMSLAASVGMDFREDPFSATGE